MHVKAHHTVEELEAAFKKEKRARVAHRLRGVILAKQGFTAPEIALLLGSARRAVQDWVRPSAKRERGAEHPLPRSRTHYPTRPGRPRRFDR